MRTDIRLVASASILAALLALAALARGAGAAPPAAPAAPSANAATFYRQAFALLPHRGDADEAALQFDGNEPLTEDRINVARKYAKAVDLLRAGSAAARCDWGLAHEKGPELQIPELGSARLISSLVWIRALDEVRQKKSPEALEDIAALLVLARRIGKEPILVCKLIEGGLTYKAVDASRDVLGEPVPPEALRQFRQRLTTLPESLPVADAFKGEGAWLLHWLHDLEKQDPQGRAFSEGGRFYKLYASGTSDPATARKAMDVLKGRWEKPAVRAADLAAVKAAFDAGGDILSAAPEDVPRAVEAWEKAKSSSPMALLLAPGKPDKLRPLAQVADVRLDLLRAAVDVKLGGPDAIKSTRDPFGDGPFGYKAIPGGFELTSKLPEKSGPTTLKIVPRPANLGPPRG